MTQASCSLMPSALRAELRHPAVGDNSISAAQTRGGGAPPQPLSAGAEPDQRLSSFITDTRKANAPRRCHFNA